MTKMDAMEDNMDSLIGDIDSIRNTPIYWMGIDINNDMPNNPINGMANWLDRIVVVKRTEDCPECKALRTLACEMGRNIQDDDESIYLDKFFTCNTPRANNDENF